MSQFDHIWQHYFPNRQSPEEYVEQYLVRLEKLDRKKFEFWRDYQTYLASQRELKLELILDSLKSSIKHNFEFTGYRLVTSNYGDDPLCTYGSIVDGGRFNFGSISDLYKDFDCLYIGNSPATCFQEKFHYVENENLPDQNISSTEAALIPSHNTVRVKVLLETFLDLRDKNSLAAFLEVISKIRAKSDHLKKWAKLNGTSKKRVQSINTIAKLDALIVSIFDPAFKQLNTLMDLPSNSQWLAHYARLAGIQAIIYPSVRYEDGYNIAVFPQNIGDSGAVIELVDEMSYVNENRRRMDGLNCHFFKFSQEQLKEFEKGLKN